MMLVPVKSFRNQDDPNGEVIGLFQLINKTVGEFNKADLQKVTEIKNATLTVIESKLVSARKSRHTQYLLKTRLHDQQAIPLSHGLSHSPFSTFST